MKRLAIIGSILLALTGCSNMHTQSGQIEHSVFIWLKEPGNADARQKLIDRSYTFRQIPGVQHVFAGPALGSNRQGVDSSYDVGVIIVFDNEQSLRAFDHNPIHLKAIQEVLVPLAAKFVVYDFRVE